MLVANAQYVSTIKIYYIIQSDSPSGKFRNDLTEV